MIRAHSLMLCLVLGPAARALAAQVAAPGPDEARAQLVLGAAEDATLVQLRDGRTLWGAIVDHDAERLVLARLEDGGRLELPWSLLAPRQEGELRERFGYVDTSDDEVLVEAHRLALKDGREVVGKIVGRSDEALIVKSRGIVQQVPMRFLAEAATVIQVPALDVYSRDELYQRELERLAPDTAAGHEELARYCERVLDYGRAVEHYARALELDPAAEDVRAALERARQKAESQAQVDYLREVDSERARKRYDEALAMARAFAELYPESPLAADAARKIGRIERERERVLREETVRRWHAQATRLALRAARTMTYEEALAWLEERMSQEILEAVTADLQRSLSPAVTADEVLAWWAERDVPRQRMHKASYGHGTWILGPERAREGIDEERAEEQEVAAASETDDARKRMEEKIQRYLKVQELARRAKSTAERGEDVQAFWEQLSSSSRAQWLLAYYAENSGDMRVERVQGSNCSECGGSGVREVLNVSAMGRTEGSGDADVRACSTCHNVGLVRRVHYR